MKMKHPVEELHKNKNKFSHSWLAGILSIFGDWIWWFKPVEHSGSVDETGQDDNSYLNPSKDD